MRQPHDLVGAPLEPPTPLARGEREKILVVHVTTVPMSLRTHLSGQLTHLRKQGFSFQVITSPGPELAPFVAVEPVPVHEVEMVRAITPGRDLVALFRIWRTLRKLRPTIVHSHTPKGGLLGMIAATLARTPARVYHVRGLPFVTATGRRRKLLRTTEWISCRLAHRIIAVSHSMRRIAIEEGLCPPGKIRVALGGSGNGVDATRRFVPPTEAARRAAREQLALPEDAIAIGFVGRVSREKGIGELAAAWSTLREKDPRAHLLLVGWVELQDGLPAELLERLRADPRVRMVGAVSDIAPTYAAMDLVVLPTYREGFPNVVLEAGAMGLPVVATDVPGCVDSVVDGATGALVPARDAVALEAAVARYVADAELRKAHGEAARRHVLAAFAQEGIWDVIGETYRELMRERG